MCEYCEKEKHIEEDENHTIYAYIYGKKLRIAGKFQMFGLNFGREVIINYCPMCGRKLN